MPIRPLTVLLVLVALVCLAVRAFPALDARAAAGLNGLKVTGNRITDASGKPIMLRGVNRSGTEYACIQGWGIFDGPSDLASVQAIASWHVNYVRVLLNEDCWLNKNVPDSSLAGANYQTAIKDYVDLLNANGIYVELSLIFGAPGTTPATVQPDAPDQDHSPAFWTSVATFFKSYPNVFFGIWGEPANITWSCWLNGCLHNGYHTAGSQSLVTAIRATGATQIISVPGIDYANQLDQWLTYEPTDPDNQLIAEEHVYGDNTCGALDGGTCLNTNTAPLTALVPVIFGETGESVFSDECGASRMQFLLPWADAHNIGYAAWVWDTWSGDCLSLITDYNNGIPNTTDPAGSGYAKYIHDHLIAVTAGRAVAQASAATPGGRSGVSQSTPAPTPTPRPAVTTPVLTRPETGVIALVAPDLRMPPGFYRALITS